MVVFPSLIGVIQPDSLTVRIDVSPETNFNFLFVALSGLTVA